MLGIEQIEEIRFQSDDYELAGTIVIPQHERSSPGVLFIHGAAENGQGRVSFRKWQLLLAHQGFSSFAFDARGVGDSEPLGQFQLSTLRARLSDTVNAYNYFADSGVLSLDRLAVIGNSMGGHVTARFAGSHYNIIKAIVLKNCAAYAAEAEDKLMKKPGDVSSEFSEVIRVPNSWNNSPAFKAVSHFKGPVLVIHSESDTVVSEKVQNSWIDSIQGPYEYVVLKNTPHIYMNRLDQVSVEAEKILYDASISFLQRYL